MFGLGAPEIVIILILAVLILGPNKLPELGASVGKTLKELRESTKSITEDITKPLKEATEEFKQDIIDPIKADFDIKAEVQSFKEDIVNPLKEEMGDLKDFKNPIASLQDSFKDINNELKNTFKDSTGIKTDKLPNIPPRNKEL